MSGSSGGATGQGGNGGAPGERPLGLLLLILVVGVLTAFRLLTSISVLSLGGLYAVVGLVGVGMSVGFAVAIYGLYLLEAWGLKLFVALVGISVLVELATFSGYASIFGLALTGAVLVWALAYVDHFE